MARIITKGLIGQQDLSIGTGTFTRSTSTGGTQTLNQISGIIQGNSIPLNAPGQVANLVLTSILNSAVGGLYMVSAYISTAVISGNPSTRPKVTLSWTSDENGNAQSVDILGPDSSNSLTRPGSGCFPLQVLAGATVNISTLGYIGGSAPSLQYDLYVRILGPF